jgi:2-polyprenyl-3-methyl-5-hydroxy-6-metoxy-1,4-benzoquinol methylase
MATTTSRMGTFYNEKFAAAELRRYRQKGPIPPTRALIEALKAEGVGGGTLLDIGGGIGAIQHELLDAGLARATSVDASAPYLDAAREESDRRGHGGRVTYRHGDFVELAESVPGCRHRDARPCAQRLYGLVYPRDTLMMRLSPSR